MEKFSLTEDQVGKELVVLKSKPAKISTMKQPDQQDYVVTNISGESLRIMRLLFT